MHDSLTVTADKLETFVFCEGEGPPVVMLHGWAATSDCWRYTFDALKADYQVVAPDLPGHGRTKGQVRPSTVQGHVRWLDGLLDALNLDDITLMGNSMGGAISAAYTLAHPERVARLVLVDGLGMGGRIPWKAAGPLMARLPDAAASWLTGRIDPHLLRYMEKRVFMDPWGTPREIIETMTNLNRKRGLGPMRAGLQLLLTDFLPPGKRQAFAEQLEAIQTPTLITWGRHDGLLPVENAFAGAERIPTALVSIFEHSAHSPMVDEPEAFNQVVTQFLESGDAGITGGEMASRPDKHGREGTKMRGSTQLVKIGTLTEEKLKPYFSQAPDVEMEAYFGPHAAEMRAYAEAAVLEEKRGDSMIIILPGLMGSLLEDVGNNPELLWINPLAYLKGHLNHLDLAHDGRRDATPGVRVTAPAPLWLVYGKMLLRLQREYEVYTFPYDWRRSTADMALQLHRFIKDKLADSPRDKVTLVGHSLGGLVIMDYLIGEMTRAYAERVVRRVITLGTPFRGVVEAVSILSNSDDPKLRAAKALNRANDPQRMVRSFPSLYQILPAPKGLYNGWDPLPEVDIWDVQPWLDQGIALDAGHLAQAKAHHQALAAADPQVPLYTVVGVYYETPVQLLSKALGDLPRKVREGLQGGDGTVEVASATYKNRPVYFVHEVHIELVLEKEVIFGIMDWVEGDEPHRLVKHIDEVVLDDVPMRAVEFEPQAAGEEEAAVDYDVIAEKVRADEPLDYQELKEFYTLM